MERAEAEAIYDAGRETVVAVLLRMDEQIQQLTKQVAKQGEQIAELQRRLNRNSRNSSTPPSQDPPGAPERRRPDPSERAQGAQPDHRGKGRKCPKASEVTPLPAGSGETPTGEPMPDIAAAVRRSRRSH